MSVWLSGTRDDFMKIRQQTKMGSGNADNENKTKGRKNFGISIDLLFLQR